VVADAVNDKLPPTQIVAVEGVILTAVGAEAIDNIFVEIALPQGELPVAVKVSVTEPAAISAALGV
jgi:hypothetical protein